MLIRLALFEGIFQSLYEGDIQSIESMRRTIRRHGSNIGQGVFLPEIALCLDDLSTILKTIQKVELAEISIRESVALHRLTAENSQNRTTRSFLSAKLCEFGYDFA